MKKAFVLLVLAGVFAFAYQNCGKAGFEDQSQLDSFNGASSSDEKVLNAPFPFDASINFLTYMSCPMVNNRPSGPYFSYRLGAYDATTLRLSSVIIPPAGLGLRSEFISYMNSKYPHPGDRVTSDQIQSLINQHPVFKGAQVQASIRSFGDFSVRLQANSGTQVFANSMDLLSLPGYVSTLADNPGVLMNSFPVATLARQNMNMTLLDGAGHDTAITFRNNDMMRSYLHVGFTNQGDTAIQSTPVNTIGPKNTSGYYGRAYLLDFGPPNDEPAYLGNPPLGLRVSGGVREVDLTSGLNTDVLPARWTCFSYAIVRAEDAQRCPVERMPVDSIRLNIIRKTLPISEWDVNTQLRCVVPKTSSDGCYLTTSRNDIREPIRPWGVDYPTVLDQNNAGFFPLTGIEYRYYTQPCTQVVNGAPARECVNFASFCYKQQ